MMTLFALRVIGPVVKKFTEKNKKNDGAIEEGKTALFPPLQRAQKILKNC
ncbi:hypothetical protein K1Y37_13050 [Serratia marcescens]|nr:hypothetical protein [Serratia marcescens]MCW6023763.1 hypothetical protein [Serratia marcescens]